MIQSEVYKLKEAALVAKDMPLQAGQELEIVMDVFESLTKGAINPSAVSAHFKIIKGLF